MSEPPRRQAIVVVHGMGEQKPGQTLVPFSQMILRTEPEGAPPNKYFVRPTLVGDSFEARFHHIPLKLNGRPNGSLGADTDVYEYHWSYRMKDNRLKDLGAVAYRTLLPTKKIGHLVAIILLLSLAAGVAGVARDKWNFPRSIWQLDLASINAYMIMTTWVDEGLATLALPTVQVVLVLALAFLVGGVTYFGLHRRPIWLRGLAAVTAIILVSGIGIVVTGARLFADQSLVNGGAVALVLVAIALLLMVTSTPIGLRSTWIIVWITMVTLADRLVLEQWDEIVAAFSAPETLPKVLFGGIGAFLVTQLLGRIAPWLTTSFVDVVRYVDTSPRSYEVRRDIRKGMVDLLEQLHTRSPGEPPYDRILVVAHSLGSYIAYDAISSLWYRRVGPVDDVTISKRPKPFTLPEYRDQQARDFADLKTKTTNDGDFPVWRISHLLTFGSPMSLADTLVTKTRTEFLKMRDKHFEFFICPPPDDVTRRAQDDAKRWAVAPPPRVVARREVAAFGVVQWTNVWYPVDGGLFGDPFGGTSRLSSATA